MVPLIPNGHTQAQRFESAGADEEEEKPVAQTEALEIETRAAGRQ